MKLVTIFKDKFLQICIPIQNLMALYKTKIAAISLSLLIFQPTQGRVKPFAALTLFLNGAAEMVLNGAFGQDK